MGNKVLTAAAVERLKPPACGQAETFDAALPGFGVRVSYRGTKSYVLFYRFAGKLRRATLGRHPAITLAEAREKAHDILRAVEEGRDPSVERAMRRVEATRASADTYSQAVDDFIEKYAKAKKGNKRWRDQRRNLLNASKDWHKIPVTSITRRDIHDALDKFVAAGKPYMANRTHAALSTFFRWLHSRDRVPENPMEMVQRPFDGEKPRERVWANDELKAIWKCGDQLPGNIGPYLRLVLLVGQRRNEISEMRWDEVELETATWTLPKGRHKGGRAHTFPLSPLAVRILRGIKKVKDNPFVFPGRGTRDGKPAPMTAGSKIQKSIQEASKVKDFTFHDARRTFRTGLDQLNVPPHVKDECLNHARHGVGDKHYSQYDYLDEQREAFDAWAGYIEKLVYPEGVVGLHG